MGYKYTDEGSAHLHTYDGKPLIGTSSAASVLAKPLTWWAAGLAVEKFGWINKKDGNGKFRTSAERLDSAKVVLDKIRDMEVVPYLQLLDEAYSAHSKKLDSSAIAGTDLHAEVERFVKDRMAGSVGIYDPKIKPFIEWADKKVKRFIYSEKHCYSIRLWVGGISDIGYEDYEGNYGIIDIKSSKEAYLSQFWQCVGYAIQIEENGLFDKDGNLILKLDKPINHVVVFPFGMKVPEAQYYYDMVGGKEAFEAEILLYKKLNT